MFLAVPLLLFFICLFARESICIQSIILGASYSLKYRFFLARILICVRVCVFTYIHTLTTYTYLIYSRVVAHCCTFTCIFFLSHANNIHNNQFEGVIEQSIVRRLRRSLLVCALICIPIGVHWSVKTCATPTHSSQRRAV